MVYNQPVKPKGDPLEQFDPDYLVTLDEIYHSHWCAGRKLRIELLREAVAHFWPEGHPTALIHVTGTNGKGSVIYYLEQGLRAYGDVGAWNGPHLFDYAERFHINCQPVSHPDIVRTYREKIVPYQSGLARRNLDHTLSFAEIGILVSLHLFERYQVKWGMMEVGAGGRYTPLMALKVAACVLTNIGDDHTKTLGTEKWQRVLEKAGIARTGVPFFTADRGTTAGYVAKTIRAQGGRISPLSEKEEEAVARRLPRAPLFKIRNLALAVKIIRHFYPRFEFDPSLFRRELPGRFSYVAPNIIADVSHNSDKVKSFIQHLKSTHPGRKFKFILGLTRKRKADQVFKPLLDISSRIVITSASYAGRDPEEVFRELKQAGFKNLKITPDPEQAFREERQNLSADDILVLTGSAYMIEQALNKDPFVKHLNRTYGRRYQ